MHKRFILLLGMLLGSDVLVPAQTLAVQIVPAQSVLAPRMAVVVTAPTPLIAASFLLPENPGKSVTHFSYEFARAYERDQGLEGLKNLSRMREVKTLFLTQSLLPLMQL